MLSFLNDKFHYLSEHSLIIQNSIRYFFAIGVNRGMSFILLPILTNIVDPTDYGIISIATVLIGLFKNVIGLNPSLYIMVNFYKTKKDEFGSLISNLFALIFISSIIFFIPYYFLTINFEDLLDQQGIFLLIIFMTALFIVIETLILALIQMEKKGKLFLVFSVISALFQVSFVISFVVIKKWNWQGKLLGDLLAEFIFCLILMIYLRKKYTLKWVISWPKIKKIITFSIPMLPHSLSLWAMNFVDRLFLEKLIGIQSVGVYSAAYNLGLGLMLIYEAIQRAWQPFFFEALEKEDENHKKRIVWFTWIYYIFAFVLFFISTCIAKKLSPFLFGNEFQSAIKFIPYIFLGYTFQGMYRVIGGYIYHLNKNWVLAVITVSSTILNILLNIFLIKKNGIIGAAQSTAITFLFMFVITKIYVLTKKTMPWFSFINVSEK